MFPLTDQTIRASFVNASQRERKDLSTPDLGALNWDRLDFLGWRDPKLPKLGYVVAVLDAGPTGILLREADGHLRSRPQCSWCEDVTLPNDVVLFSTKRSGAGGRNGNTVGSLVCANFECSTNVRKKPPVAYIGFDVEAARQKRIESLRERVANFVTDVRDGG